MNETATKTSAAAGRTPRRGDRGLGRRGLGGRLTDVQMERLFKGLASRHRLGMLRRLEAAPDLPMETIARQCRLRWANTSEHLRKLLSGGLVLKQRAGRRTLHRLTPSARKVLALLRELE